jgi:hypothetical protein
MERKEIKMSDKPYDEAKKRWLYMAIYALSFGIAGIVVRYGIPNVHF